MSLVCGTPAQRGTGVGVERNTFYYWIIWPCRHKLIIHSLYNETKQAIGGGTGGSGG